MLNGHTHTHTHTETDPTTVTLAAHAHRGLITHVYAGIPSKPYILSTKEHVLVSEVS